MVGRPVGGHDPQLAGHAKLLKDLAAKTHRGLHGRVEEGRSAGGISYGYRASKTVYDIIGQTAPLKQQIDKVRRFKRASRRMQFQRLGLGAEYRLSSLTSVSSLLTVGVEAAVLSKAMDGKPVKVVWTRDDDLHNDYFHTVSVEHLEAGVDANGLPISLVLSEGQAYDGHSAHLMLDTLEPGSILLADRAYDADSLCDLIVEQGGEPVIPPRRHRKLQRGYDRIAYKQRWGVEGFFAKLTKKRLKRGVFRSLQELKDAIHRFLDHTNANPKPFTWTNDPNKIIAAVKRGHQVLDSIH